MLYTVILHATLYGKGADGQGANIHGLIDVPHDHLWIDPRVLLEARDLEGKPLHEHMDPRQFAHFKRVAPSHFTLNHSLMSVQGVITLVNNNRYFRSELSLMLQRYIPYNSKLYYP